MTLDAVVLARVQFGLTVSFHIIFPTMSIGLAAFLTITEGMWLGTKDTLYLTIYKFWLTIFALGFGVGVVTGLVLSFEFGTNFATFARMAGPVIGPMIGLEVLTSFFLEAGFLGVMLFGLHRVGPKLHFFATCMVTLGTLMSASWILSANSWMQTPAGFARVGDHLAVTDWLKVIFNPSYLYRLPHMIFAALITGSFFVAGVGAWYLIRDRHLAFGRRTFSMGLGFATILISCQLFIGDNVGEIIAQHQPAKIEAIEGEWRDRSYAPYLMFIAPNIAKQRNDVEVGIPYIGSWLVTHKADGVVPGIIDSPQDQRPATAPVFYAFRVMYLIATLMFAVAAVGLWLRIRGRLFTTRWFLKLMVLMTPAGFLATLGGWYTAEMGRQPYVIYGVLRTADAVSPVPAGAIVASLVVIASVYALFLGGFLTLLIMILRRGPTDAPATASVSGSVKRGLMPAPAVAGPQAKIV